MATGDPRAYREGVPAPAPPTRAPLTAAEFARRLAAHRRAEGFARFLSACVPALAGALLIAGGTLLALRISGNDPAPALWAFAAGTTFAVGSAVWRGREAAPTPRDAFARLDRALRSGGLLMTLADFPAGGRPAEWLARLEPRRDRWADARPRLPLGRFLKTLGVPMLFAGLAWTVPVGDVGDERNAVDRGVAGGRLTGELDDLLAGMGAAEAGDPAELARAGADLRALTAGIGENGPTASQLEALDALRDRMMGAAGASGGVSGERVERLADGLSRGADLLAGSGLLESDAVRDLAANVGLRDPAEVQAMLEQVGANRETLKNLAASLTEEQRGALAAAGARLARGEDPAELLAALPPETIAAVIGDRPGLLTPQPTGAGPPVGSGAPPSVGPPAFANPLPGGALELGGAAARLWAPGLASAADTAAGLFGTTRGAPETPADPPAPVADAPVADAPVADPPGPTPSSIAPPGPPAGPVRSVAAGRPIPPRMRGVVRRYFSGQTPAPPAAD